MDKLDKTELNNISGIIAENKSDLGLKEFVALQKSIFKNKIIYLYMPIINIVLGLAFILFSITREGLKFTAIYIAGLVVALIGILILLMPSLLISISKRSFIKTNQSKNITNLFKFYQGSLDVTTQQDEKIVSRTNLEYTNIYKVIESPVYYFIYISSNQAMIVDKTRFKSGSPAKLTEHLMSNVKKYKTQKL